MMKPVWQRIVSLLLAVLVAATMSLVVLADEPAVQEDSSEEGLVSVQPEGVGYMEYRQENGAYLSEEMALDLEGALKEGCQMQDGGLLVPADKSVSFSFTLASDASFEITLDYAPLAGHRQEDEITLLFDGELPFEEASQLRLPRIWKDATAIEQDAKGNDLIPEQEEVIRRHRVTLRDDSLFVSENLTFHLSAGQHTFTILSDSADILLYSVAFTLPEELPAAKAYKASLAAAGYKEISDVLLKQQAEVTLEKSSQSVYPQYDRSTPATEPYHVSRIRRNVIGKNSWSSRGDDITWQIDDVPADGLYYITLKYLQNEKISGTVYRSLYVNGQIPCAEFAELSFSYDVSWQQKTLGDSEGAAIPVYLKKGSNTITMEAVLGAHEIACQKVQDATSILSQLYIQMVMVCGSSPDTFRDYHLDTEIPGLMDSMQEVAKMLEEAVAEFVNEEGKKTADTAALDRGAEQLHDLVKNPDTIPRRISAFRDTISSLSDWLYNAGDQPLTLDYILIHSADAQLPPYQATFWQSLVHTFETFFASFVEDYDAVSDTEGEGESISVWASTGRDQIQLMWDMVRDDFTPETDISVQLSLVQTGFIEATLAGAGPDIAVGIARGQPVNLACRGVLTDLSAFEDFDEVADRFSQSACDPYTFDGGVYALPNTQSFFVMFYRTDVLSSLGIEVPQTWDEVQATISRLQKRNMTFGLPYTVISAAAAVDLGMGAKDMFGLLLLQNGGSYYTDDATACLLEEEAGVSAFTRWCGFYTDYGFDLIYDFYTRFRYGEMPIGIASFEMYSTLLTAAPEIRGLWDMAPIPGTLQADGSIDRSLGGAGSGVVMFNKAENPEACWEFMKWWTTADVQGQYGIRVENILGPAGRYSTANLEAFDTLPWGDDQLEVLHEQRSWVREIPEIPGSYFVSRCLDNAFRSVIYDGKNPQESFSLEIDNINREITRKRKELGLPLAKETE